MQISKNSPRNNGPDDRRESKATKILAVTCLALVTSILTERTVHSFVYKTPEWVMLREMKVEDEFLLTNLSDVLEFVNGEHKRLHRPRDVRGRKDELNFTAPFVSDYTGQIEPMWRCKDPNALDGRKDKLIFVHVYRTAGITVRALLQAYAQMCHAGIALIASCNMISLESLQNSDSWRIGSGRHKGSKCPVRRAVDRDGNELHDTKFINTTLVQDHIDIVAGQLPVGSGHVFKGNDGNRRSVQYVTFLRDPIYKYVSTFLTLHPMMQLNTTIDLIKNTVSKAVKDNAHYDKYSDTFITPVQRAAFNKFGFGLSREEASNMAMRNLVQNNVLIGIVERMPESLEMLQHVLDEDGVMNSLFEYFGKRDNDGNVRVVNLPVSERRLSTAEVVAALEEDDKFMDEIREFLKLEIKIYSLALGMHMQQYESIRTQRTSLGFA